MLRQVIIRSLAHVFCYSVTISVTFIIYK